MVAGLLRTRNVLFCIKTFLILTVLSPPGSTAKVKYGFILNIIIQSKFAPNNDSLAGSHKNGLEVTRIELGTSQLCPNLLTN